MKKSEKVLTEYHKRNDELIKGIDDLKKEVAKERTQLEESKQQYEDYVGAGMDDKADDLLDDMEALEQSIKRKSRRLETKQRLQKKAHLDNVIGTLSHAKRIKEDFQDEVKKNDDTISKLFTELENALDERKRITADFEDIYNQYIEIKENNRPSDEQGLREYNQLIRPFQVYATPPEFISAGNDLKIQMNVFKKNMRGK